MAVTLLMTGYYRHPKLVAANRETGHELAETLWVRGLDYVNEQRSDGIIPTGVPAILTPSRTTKRVDALVNVGLWDVVPAGWYVHDWHVWNRSAAELDAIDKAKREKKAKAGKAGASARWGSRLSSVPNG